MKKETSIKMNNKGFSLVELIIAIAIMAVLIGILAPQFIKYVERSRNLTDITNAQEITNAIQVYAADTTATPAFTARAYTVTVAASGITAPAPITNATALGNALIEAGVTKVNCKSKTAWKTYTVTATVAADGKISFTYSATGTNAADFVDAME
ncbi:MAG: prepilin-type N-terminal cleavage/methylation domain-containing protein [Lachnospiraceae bacterium]|nr:prepilin-type N-terminal cleavage/methylation domain-containing protein [Lachnospiraceae bacterium]